MGKTETNTKIKPNCVNLNVPLFNIKDVQDTLTVSDDDDIVSILEDAIQSVRDDDCWTEYGKQYVREHVRYYSPVSILRVLRDSGLRCLSNNTKYFFRNLLDESSDNKTDLLDAIIKSSTIISRESFGNFKEQVLVAIISLLNDYIRMPEYVTTYEQYVVVYMVAKAIYNAMYHNCQLFCNTCIYTCPPVLTEDMRTMYIFYHFPIDLIRRATNSISTKTINSFVAGKVKKEIEALRECDDIRGILAWMYDNGIDRLPLLANDLYDLAPNDNLHDILHRYEDERHFFLLFAAIVDDYVFGRPDSEQDLYSLPELLWKPLWAFNDALHRLMEKVGYCTCTVARTNKTFCKAFIGGECAIASLFDQEALGKKKGEVFEAPLLDVESYIRVEEKRDSLDMNKVAARVFEIFEQDACLSKEGTDCVRKISKNGIVIADFLNILDAFGIGDVSCIAFDNLDYPPKNRCKSPKGYTDLRDNDCFKMVLMLLEQFFVNTDTYDNDLEIIGRLHIASVLANAFKEVIETLFAEQRTTRQDFAYHLYKARIPVFDIKQVRPSANDKPVANREKKGRNNMDKKNSIFSRIGFVKDDSLALTINGDIAVANADGDYVRYDKETETFVNMMDFVIPNSSRMLLMMPALQLEEDSIIYKNGKYYQVFEIGDADFKGVNMSDGSSTTIKRQKLLDAKGANCDIYMKVTNPFKNNMMLAMCMCKDDTDFDPLMLMLMNQQGDTNNMSNLLPLLMRKDKVDDKMLMLMMCQQGGTNANMLPFLMMGDDADMKKIAMFSMMAQQQAK